MIKLALVGKNISHSKSKEIYEKILDKKIDYSLFDFSKPESIPLIEDLMTNLDGLSITSPYKDHFLDQVEIVPELFKLGAINCIKKVGTKFYGTNTDYFAVEQILKNYLNEFDKIYVLLLGNGLMAKMSLLILKRLGVSFKQFTRNEYDFNFLNLIEYTKDIDSEIKIIVVNACSREFCFKGELDQSYLFWDYNYALNHHQETIVNQVFRYDDGMELLRIQGLLALKYWKLF